MRKLIAGMKVSLDGKFGNADGYADWVDAWSEDYGITPQIDACVLGGRMYPGYEQYWTAIRNAPDQPLPMTGKLAAPAEIQWAEFTARTPHYVLSRTLDHAAWPQTRFIRSFDDLAALKRQPGKDIFLMGGGTVVAGAIEAGLLDELRLIVYPLIAGDGQALFRMPARHKLELLTAQPLAGGRLSLAYRIG